MSESERRDFYKKEIGKLMQQYGKCDDSHTRQKIDLVNLMEKMERLLSNFPEKMKTVAEGVEGVYSSAVEGHYYIRFSDGLTGTIHKEDYECFSEGEF